MDGVLARGIPGSKMVKAINELHEPVALERCLDILGESLGDEGAVYVDCTLGLGGHSEAFLKRFPKLTLVGIDRDTNALKLAGERLENLVIGGQLALHGFARHADGADELIDEHREPADQRARGRPWQPTFGDRHPWVGCCALKSH